MWPISDRLATTFRRSHSRRIYLEILKGGQPVASTDIVNRTGLIQDPGTGLYLRTIDGSVDVSRQSIRRACRITFGDPSGVLVPEGLDDLLAPYATEIRAYIGARYFDAPNPSPTLAGPGLDYELVPVGTFVITDIESDYPNITVSGSDRMWYMSNFDKPFVIAAGQSVASVLSQLLALRIPTNLKDVNFPDDASADTTVPAQMFDADSGSADALASVATSAGWQIYADPLGSFIATHEPSIDDQEVATYFNGPGGGLIGRPKRAIGGEVTNVVVFTNEGSQNAPVRGYAADLNPESLTYVGRIGVRPRFAASPILVTTDQANKAARTELQRHLGVSDTVSVTILPNPAHETGDVIRVTDPTVEIDSKYLIDSFNLTFKANALGLTCRTQVIR